MKKRKVLIVLALIAAFAILYWWSQFTITVTYFDLNGPSNLKIMQISDIHNNLFGKDQSRIMNIIRQENPDVIVLTGDINDGEKIENTELLLKQIKNIPVLFVTGNHEERNEKILNKCLNMLERQNVKHLNKETFKMKNVTFYGIDNAKSPSPKNYDTVDGYSILLTHVPEYAIKGINKYGYDIALTGHVHGGQ